MGLYVVLVLFDVVELGDLVLIGRQLGMRTLVETGRCICAWEGLL